MACLSRLAPGALAAALIALTSAASAVAAPAPATVRIAVEGGARTLIAATTVTTRETRVQRSGADCSGTSAGGALETASAGAWTAAHDPSTGLIVDSVLGERHPAAGDARGYVLFVNSVIVPGSPCAIELNPGDTVLYAVSSLPASAIAPGCRTSGRDGLCGTPDRTAPTALITSIREQQTFAARRAPLRIFGRVAADPSGLRDVRIRLTRTLGPRCHFFSGIEDTFLRARRCGAAGPQFFSIGDAADWSYVLPRRPTPGRYTLDVQAVDRLGNVSPVGARGRDRVVFRVR